jgi:HAD superfamily hydrolase (TIGR01549 family)
VKNYDGFIFDVDGTLTSTNELIFESFNYITKKYINKTYTPEGLISMFGPTEEELIEQLTGKELAADACRDYMHYYSERHNELADLYPGIDEILKAIKIAGIPMSIYTGKGRSTTAITLKKLGISDYFGLIVTGDDIQGHKPSPEGITNFLKKFSLNKERVLMLGDAPADIQAARAAGIKIASVVWDCYAKETVMNSGSDFVFHTVKELKDFILLNIY